MTETITVIFQDGMIDTIKHDGNPPSCTSDRLLEALQSQLLWERDEREAFDTEEVS